MFGPFATGNNDVTFPVNKFLAATIIFPRVNSATKTGRAVYFSRLQDGERAGIYTRLPVFMKSGTGRAI